MKGKNAAELRHFVKVDPRYRLSNPAAITPIGRGAPTKFNFRSFCSDHLNFSPLSQMYHSNTARSVSDNAPEIHLRMHLGRDRMPFLICIFSRRRETGLLKRSASSVKCLSSFARGQVRGANKGRGLERMGRVGELS